MSQWAVIRTKPNCERLAIDNLKRQDFTYYQPLILEKRIKKQKLVSVEVPLFPCYLFVQIGSQWRSLNYTYGVASVVSVGSVPAILSDDIIQGLRKREHNGYIQLPKAKLFQVGDTVSIKDGPFQGQKGLVERMNGSERQKVLLALLDSRLRVLIDDSSLEAAA